MDTNPVKKPKYNMYIGVTVSIVVMLLVFGYTVVNQQSKISTFQDVTQEKMEEKVAATSEIELASKGVTVTNIKPNDEVRSPVAIEGQVQKAKFPGQAINTIVVDDNGLVLKIEGIELKSTSNGLASFVGNVEYQNPSSETGKIFLEGASEDEEGNPILTTYIIPVTFSEGAVAGASTTQE